MTQYDAHLQLARGLLGEIEAEVLRLRATSVEDTGEGSDEFRDVGVGSGPRDLLKAGKYHASSGFQGPEELQVLNQGNSSSHV